MKSRWVAGWEQSRVSAGGRSGFQRDLRRHLGVTRVLISLIGEMVSQVYTYVKTYKAYTYMCAAYWMPILLQ